MARFASWEGKKMVDSLNEEIMHHFRCLRKADNTNDDYCHGLTQLEYHMAKIIDRLLIATGHARMAIRLQLGDRRARKGVKSNTNDYKQMELDFGGYFNEKV